MLWLIKQKIIVGAQLAGSWLLCNFVRKVIGKCYSHSCCMKSISWSKNVITVSTGLTQERLTDRIIGCSKLDCKICTAHRPSVCCIPSPSIGSFPRNLVTDGNGRMACPTNSTTRKEPKKNRPDPIPFSFPLYPEKRHTYHCLLLSLKKFWNCKKVLFSSCIS